VGVGPGADVDADVLRDAAATAMRATATIAGRVGLRVGGLGDVPPRAAGRALAEGGLLARYRYSALQSTPRDTPLGHVAVEVDGAAVDDVRAGVAAGRVAARAAGVARDLANTPPGHLSATAMADVAADLGGRFGFEVEVFDKAQLVDLRCGGILGVNAGSTEEPRMIKLRYRPEGTPTGHLGLVGKGIMYDSGGISIKPSDPMHLLMKMDMGGAAAILGAFTALREAGATAAVTAWLMCTDNMPSGSAYKLGDVLTARNGTTVEVKNTDAEGRLAMMDGLVLATEEGVDAIVDIATLTGASLLTFGTYRAPVYGTSTELVDRVVAASAVVDEPVWRMPLERRYRPQLDSDIADMSNLGGPFAGSTTAALFLAEFVGEVPWAHLDIAGTMQSEKDDSWRSQGATGYGARLLLEVARDFLPVG
jgi:leucyl aminopeptidase